MPAKSIRVNLAPKDEFESSVVGRILKWALTAGKSIVVLTEFVVILAFLSRFKLDVDLNDLNEAIIQKQAIIESYSDVEEEMKRLQTHMAVVKTVNDNTIGVGEFDTQFAAKLPRDVILDSLDISKNSVSLKGGAGSETGLAALINNFRTDETYNTVNIGEIKFNQRKGLIEFTLAASLVKQKPQARAAGGTRR